MARRRDHYREANPDESEAHPIDEEVERRLRRAMLRKRIITAQGRVMATLGDASHRYLRLEELVGRRDIDREEVVFNVGFEHGLVSSREDVLSATLGRQGTRGRALGARIVQLAANAGPTPRALAVLVEVAWGLALG